MDAYERSNRIEAAALSRVTAIYAKALTTAIKNKRAFLRKIKDIDEGRIKPPQYYVDRDEVDKWREGFIKQLIRQEGIIEGIMEELNRAGVDAADVIHSSLIDIYAENRAEAVEVFAGSPEAARANVSFAMPKRREIEILMQKNESPFSKLAYENLGKNSVIRRRLQAELAQAAILGESQQKLIKRIQKITGQATYQARRVAQTERTRVQSQARWQVGQEAAAMGVRVVNEWSARMVNTRDTHAALDGTKKPQGEPFVTIKGNKLHYPGDPAAPASEVINCHCVLIPDVLHKGETIEQQRGGNAIATAGKEEPKQQQAKQKTQKKASAPLTAREQAYETLKQKVGVSSYHASLNRIDESLLVENVGQLEMLERKFGVIHQSQTSVSTCTEKGTQAKVSSRITDPTSQKLYFEATTYAERKKYLKTAQEEKRKRWSMPFAEEKASVYNITHEYGHMLQNVLIKREMIAQGWKQNAPRAFVNDAEKDVKKRYKWYNDIADSVEAKNWAEIEKIAKKMDKSYSTGKYLSRYGQSSYAEAFAETFANSQCGAPNVLGNAMNVWLKEKGLTKP